MNTSQIHLAFTHLPVVLTLVGLVILIVSLIKKNKVLTTVSFYIFVFAGLAALPVYFTGEGAEETVEHLPGVSESLIEKHEEFAKIAFIAILITGIISLAGLFRFTYTSLAKPVRVLTLAFAISSSVLLAQTAHLGGQIRHTEIRTANSSLNASNSETKTIEKDDD
jgi:uncharacterized membrane protein